VVVGIKRSKSRDMVADDLVRVWHRGGMRRDGRGGRYSVERGRDIAWREAGTGGTGGTTGTTGGTGVQCDYCTVEGPGEVGEAREAGEVAWREARRGGGGGEGGEGGRRCTRCRYGLECHSTGYVEAGEVGEGARGAVAAGTALSCLSAGRVEVVGRKRQETAPSCLLAGCGEAEEVVRPCHASRRGVWRWERREREWEGLSQRAQPRAARGR
jgi:hypothetical protein